MRRLLTVVSMSVTAAAALMAQAPQPSILGPKLEARPTVTVAIPGVVAARREGRAHPRRSHRIRRDRRSAGRDRRLHRAEQPHIVRINADDSLSTLVMEPATTRALGVDSKGRLLGLVLSNKANPADHLRILHGPGKGEIIATEVEGKRLFQANDFVVTERRRLYDRRRHAHEAAVDRADVDLLSAARRSTPAGSRQDHHAERSPSAPTTARCT